MRILLICFLLMSLPSFANTVYYNVDTDTRIIDVSDNKTLAEVKVQFGEGEYEVLVLGEDENYEIKNGKLEKYNFKEANKAIKGAEKAEKKIKKDLLKSKLNLTDEEIDLLIK